MTQMVCRFFAMIALTLLIASCSTMNTTKNTSPKCARLKRQMIFNRHNNNSEASWATREQNDRLSELYKEYNCT